MNRPRWIVLILCLLLLLGGIGWWFSRPSDVRVTFRGYHEENGARFAVVSLENRTSGDIHYMGMPGVPYCHFRTEGPDGVLMGPGILAGSTPRLNQLKPGERIEFHTQLRLGSHQRDVKPPFCVAVKFTTTARLRRQIYLQYFRIPRNWYPPMEELVWTDTIDK